QDPASAENVEIIPGDVIYLPEGPPEVVVLGEVRAPRAYAWRAGMRLVDVIAAAGGTLPDADLGAVTLTDPVEGKTTTLDLEAAVRDPGGAANVLLPAGSILYVPQGRQQVTVLGEVTRPGQYPVQPGMTVLDAIAQAGGLTAPADRRQVTLSRGGRMDRLDLDVLLANPGNEANRVLRGGEVIVVPRRLQAVAVLGAVRVPGSYVLDEPATLVQALAAAGGPLEAADLARVQFTSAEPSFTEEVDAQAALADPAGPANRRVRGGDVIYVPERERRVLVYGAVRSPGAYTLKTGARVLDALAAAGGPTEQADYPALTLTRRGEPPVQKVLDLARLLANPASDENELLEPGDVLYLPPARQVAILGKVARPGAYTLPPGSRLLDLIALAGGPSPDARVEAITVLRRVTAGQETPERLFTVNYTDILGTGSPEANLVLQPGDVVYLPEALRQVLVLGEVRNPGLYTIQPGMRVMDAIGLAGGPTERAALEAVGIYRGGDPRQSTTYSLGKDRLVFQGDARENPLIQPGDIIYVPETGKPDWQKIFSFLSGIKLFKDLLGL
ncbi:MAG TPA: hypothetical protein GXX55_06585, partial [Firmicutes bacterium]|nr:hypothetical protein [Bacillota bacterium]